MRGGRARRRRSWQGSHRGGPISEARCA
jgi:hypothetical protein